VAHPDGGARRCLEERRAAVNRELCLAVEELLVVGIVRDANQKFEVVVPPARGGRGN